MHTVPPAFSLNRSSVLSPLSCRHDPSITSHHVPSCFRSGSIQLIAAAIHDKQASKCVRQVELFMAAAAAFVPRNIDAECRPIAPLPAQPPAPVPAPEPVQRGASGG